MKTLALVLLLCFAQGASAESFFQTEIGLGASVARDHGDDIWVQKKGVPDSEELVSTAVSVGISADLYRADRLDVRARFDYVWLGEQHASCLCVTDANYAAHNYAAHKGSFNGFGHVQGIALTIEPGYTWRGYRLSIEAGPWVNWATWHETDTDGNVTVANHKTVPEIGYVVGAGIERGNTGLHYRYYSVRQAWNPYPGLQTGVHMITLEKRF